MQDISRQVGIAIRWLPLILIGALVAGGIAYAYTSGQPKVYEATAKLSVDPGPDPSSQHWDVAQGAAVRYATQARSRPVAQAVATTLELDESPESIAERLTTRATDTYEVVINARDEDPREARALASAVANEMRQRVKDLLITDEVRTVSAAIALNRQSIRTLQNRLDTLRQKSNKNADDRSELISLTGQISALQRDIQFYQEDSRASVRNLLEWSERPALPETPVAPRPLYWTMLALVAGGMLAVGIAFVLEYLRTHDRIRNEKDLEEIVGLPALGAVAEKRGDIKRGDPDRLVALRHPGSDAAETYRGLLAQIGFASGAARTLLVTSVDSLDGKSAVAANLASVYAEAGRNVVLVDADYRSPRLHSFFGMSNESGLTNMLIDYDVPLNWVMGPTPHSRLRLVPGGPPPPRRSKPVGPQQVESLLGRLLEVADMVVIDSPPMVGSLDAAIFAAHAQEAILVVPVGSKGEEVRELARMLGSADTELIGGVLYRQTRGAHKRAPALPIVPLTGPQPPEMSSPLRRIPQYVTSPDPSESNPQGPAAPYVAAHPPPPSTGQAPPAPAPGPMSPPPPPPPPPGPFAAPYKPGGTPSDG